ncbi:hypothetical protein HYV89_03310 [Candidatus Woesearchaeota archaeon]|nr:hypothetical protein [Candidatus Woesearchaeota archaeon]
MPLNICIEYFWRFIFELVRYSLDNILFVALTLIIVGISAKKLGPVILGIIAAGADFLIDLATAGTFGLSSFMTILVAIVIGFLWASMAFSSNIPLLIAIPNAFLMFLFGLILGLAPIPFLAPLSAVVGFLLQNSRAFNYFIGIISAFLLYFVLSFSFSILSGFCQGLDYAISLF